MVMLSTEYSNYVSPYGSKALKHYNSARIPLPNKSDVYVSSNSISKNKRDNIIITAIVSSLAIFGIYKGKNNPSSSGVGGFIKAGINEIGKGFSSIVNCVGNLFSKIRGFRI